MSTETMVLGGLFIFVIILFVAGMLLLPELFGISKNNKDVEKK